MDIREAIESALLSKSLKMDVRIRKGSDPDIIIRTIGFPHMVLFENDEKGPQHIVAYISDQRLVGDDWYTETEQGGDVWSSLGAILRK